MKIEHTGFFTHRVLSDKERKNLHIVDLIKKKGPISRTEISRAMDINMVSVSNYIKDYLDKKLIIERGFEESTGGRRPELVEFNPNCAYVIGIEVTQHEASAVLTDLSLKVVEKARRDINSYGAARREEEVISLVRGLVAASKAEKTDVKMIGLGVPGDDAANLRWKIEKELDTETLMGGDAACAAYGEKTLNPKADVDDLLYMHSDLGCGIVVKGDIYFGASCSAGTIFSFNEKVSSEKDETFAVNSQYLRPWSIDLGIVESAKQEIERGIGTKMVALAGGDLSRLTKDVVIKAATEKDETALDILRGAGMNLGIRIAYLVNLFDPEVVVIGGRVEKAGELIMEPIRKAIKKFTVGGRGEKVKVLPSGLGDEAISLGAASLAAREIFLRA